MGRQARIALGATALLASITIAEGQVQPNELPGPFAPFETWRGQVRRAIEDDCRREGGHRSALHLPTDPDRAVATPAKCLWTRRARWLSSSAMACIGNTTCCHGSEAPTPNRPGVPSDNPAVAATLTEPSRLPPEAIAVARRAVARQRMPNVRRVETVGIGERIQGGRAFRKHRGGGVMAPTRAGCCFAKWTSASGFLALQAHLSLDSTPPFRLISHWTRLTVDTLDTMCNIQSSI